MFIYGKTAANGIAVMSYLAADPRGGQARARSPRREASPSPSRPSSSPSSPPPAWSTASPARAVATRWRAPPARSASLTSSRSLNRPTNLPAVPSARTGAATANPARCTTPSSRWWRTTAGSWRRPRWQFFKRRTRNAPDSPRGMRQNTGWDCLPVTASDMLCPK